MKKNITIALFTFIFATLAFANPYSTYKEHLGLNDAKQDSFYVEVPIGDRSMNTNDTIKISVLNTCNVYPGNVEWHPYVANPSIVSAELIQTTDEDDYVIDLYIEVISNDIIGRTEITYTAYAEYDKINEVSDTFTISVDNPDYDWYEMGSSYSFLPDDCVGSGSSPWKAATHFSLFPEDSMHTFMLKQIEFGMALEENIEWKIVEFDGQPTDSLIGDLAGSILCTGAGPTYIDQNYLDANSIDSTYFTGEVALVFSSDGNFMSLDPSGESSNTWIYNESNGWALANSYTSAYNGAWYMRLQVYHTIADVDTTGINETYYAGNISNFELQQNYPNPFNPTTEINFTLNHNSVTKLTVLNSNGEVVKVLNDGRLEKGYHSFDFNGQNLNSGIYFYQLEVEGVRSTRKMILMK